MAENWTWPFLTHFQFSHFSVIFPHFPGKAKIHFSGIFSASVQGNQGRKSGCFFSGLQKVSAASWPQVLLAGLYKGLSWDLGGGSSGAL